MPRHAASRFERPMVPADFGYSPLGALAALSAALVMVSVVYAFTVWPIETAVWLDAAAVVRFVGRHPIEALFR